MRPPVAGKTRVLPFDDEDFTWEKFELFCLDYLRTLPHLKDVDFYGKRGQAQQGIDIKATIRSTGRLHLFQCKQVASFSAAQIRTAAKKFLDGEFKDQADAFTLCCTCSLRDLNLNEAKTEFCANPGFGIWDHQEISTRLSGHPSIVERYFGEAWRKYFCDSQAPEAIDWQAARQQLHSKFLYLGFSGSGVVPPGGADSTIKNPKLESAYHELNFIPEGQPESQRQPLLAKDLMVLSDHLILRGRGGSGKTTWVRRSCQRLLDEPTCFPLLIELRDMAYKWKNCNGNIQTYLKQSLGEYSVPEALVDQLLTRQVDIKPVLFVDGWDELGNLGDTLRGKLEAFLKAHKHFTCIVTSRPYGTGRPNGDDGFALLDVAPLTSEEVLAFSEGYYKACYPGAEQTAHDLHIRFSHALRSSSSAAALTGLPLLLTMMLIISITKRLPDQRHSLYEQCISNLLSAIPNQKKDEGAQAQAAEWRPEKDEERLRILAELAFQMKNNHKAESEQGIRCEWDLARDRYLPTTWTYAQREGFLFWLCNRAGVLVQSFDNSFQFAHLSFQEFLVAWHAKESIEGEGRIRLVQEKLEDQTWWEALRLWAALVHGARPQNWKPVMAELLKSDQGLCLAGAILADGVVAPDGIDPWGNEFFRRLSQEWLPQADYCSQAITNSGEFPRQALQPILDSFAKESTAFGWLRLHIWAAQIGLNPTYPRRIVPNAWTTSYLSLASGNPEKPDLGEYGFAAGRQLLGSDPFWPSLPLGALNAWPNQRRLIASTLQNWALATGTAPVEQIAQKLWPKELSPEERDWARDLARDLAPHGARDWTRDWARDLVRDLARYGARDWAHYGAGYLAHYRPSDWPRDLAGGFVRDWDRDLARGLARGLALGLRIPDVENFNPDFVSTEILAPYRSAALSKLKYDTLHPHEPIVRLIQLGARKQIPSEIPVDIDPLWPAFARHLARQSTPEDKALLESLAAHPEQRSGELGQALRFLVRGDVLYPDGSFRTLDEIADEFNLPRLPFLEDLPDEDFWE